jgi:phospholipid/cholesterol/gamma-HCH transport system permease protein
MQSEAGSSALPIRGWPVAAIIAPLTWLGGLAILCKQAIVSPWKGRHGQPALLPAWVREMDALLVHGLPLVGLVHVGLGSLLSMQAYFGAVLPESNGGVVGVGLFRNAASLMTGFTLTGLIAARIALDFAGGLKRGLDDDPAAVPDRAVGEGRALDSRPIPDAGRVVLVRVAAAMAVGPVLTLWGALIGLLIGALVSAVMLGVASGPYFGLFFEMLRGRDIVGIVAKGMLYPGLAALIVCHEMLRSQERAVAPLAAIRAAVYAFAAILACNMTWFCLVYVAGPPLGVPVMADRAM